MGIRLGVIEFERSTRPVKCDDLRQILAVGGKDVIRLAWSSLNPNYANQIRFSALDTWLCEFFNMNKNEKHGEKCIWTMVEMNLLKVYDWNVSPEFDL